MKPKKDDKEEFEEIPDHLFIYDVNEAKWVGKSPSILQEPYNKPDPTLEHQLKEKEYEIKSLESQIDLLRSVIRDALNRAD